MSAGFMKKHAFKIIVLVLLLGVGIYFATQGLFGGGTRFKDKIPAADFTLTSIQGEEVSLQSTNGKARLLYFFFSNCPDVCPPTTHALSQVQENLKKEGVFGDKTALISVTFDPERDTVERLTEFSSWYDADYSGWYFLTGEEAVTREVALSYGVGTYPTDDGNIIHQNLYILLDKEGNRRHMYLIGPNIDSIDVDQITKDMLYLAKE